MVRRIFDAGGRRDGNALALYAPDLVWDVSRLDGADFGEGVFHGHDGLRRWFREWLAAWESVSNEVDEVTGVGDQVLSITTQRSRGRASGIEVELRQYALWTISGGKAARVVWFSTLEEALAAAGAG